MFLLIDYVKNKYVYICLPLFLQFFSIIAVVFLCNFLSLVTGMVLGPDFNNYLLYLTYFYAPVSVLFPGMMFENLIVFGGICSNLFYGFIIFILYKAVLNKRKKYG